MFQSFLCDRREIEPESLSELEITGIFEYSRMDKKRERLFADHFDKLGKTSNMIAVAVRERQRLNSTHVNTQCPRIEGCSSLRVAEIEKQRMVIFSDSRLDES